MSADLQEGFLHHVEIESPSENTRHRMLQVVLTGLDIEKDVSLKHIAQRTAVSMLKYGVFCVLCFPLLW